jgi:flagellar hook-associated protein 1 FlgK
MSQALAPLEQVLAVTADAAIPSGLDQLFQSFASLATTPNGTVERQQVLEDAGQLAASLNAASNSLDAAATSTDQLIRDTVDRINEIAGQVQSYNRSLRSGVISHEDAAADATVYASLEKLAQLVDFTARRGVNGEFDILLGTGQAPLLLGDRQLPLSADFSQPQTSIRSVYGNPVTQQFDSGKLAALLDVRNNLIPSYAGDLDRLAAAVAVQVNSALQSGVDRNGAPGVNLFSFDAAQPAATLMVTGITVAELAAAHTTAPGGGGNAEDLAAMAKLPLLDGTTFTGFYGVLAGRLGRHRSTADQDRQLHEQLLAQAQAVREETSGVSLDLEATRLVQFQRAYQAAAQLLTVLNQLTGTLINMLQG